MPSQRSPLNLILGSTRIVELKIIRMSLEHYSTGIYSNAYSYIWHNIQVWCTWILNRCALQNGNVAEYRVRCTPAIGDGIHNNSFLLEGGIW